MGSTIRRARVWLVASVGMAALSALAQPDLSVTQVAPAAASVGKDVVVMIELANIGSTVAPDASVTVSFPAGWKTVWTSNCFGYTNPTTCIVSGLDGGARVILRIVVRPNAPGAATIRATATTFAADADASNNTHVVGIAVNPTPAARSVPLYRLYSPVTRAHLLTTDANEYATLGSYTGTWIQEGIAAHVFDQAGTVGGVELEGLYRMYNPRLRAHIWGHSGSYYSWTTENYGYIGEGVAGWVLPSPVAGTVPLQWLRIRSSGSFGLRTADPNEVAALVASGSWFADPPDTRWVLP